jgi:outer membrane protein assembly factor BamB
MDNSRIGTNGGCLIYNASQTVRKTSMKLLSTLALLALTSLIFAEEDWSRFRGPNGSGVSKGGQYPTQFSREKNVAWRIPVRPGKSSPVLTATRIYLTAFEGGKLYTQCFNRQTGKLEWERSIDRTREQDANTLNHPAALSAVTDGENVYVFFPDFGLISYDSKGNLRWKAPIGQSTNVMGLGASPILAENLVIVVVDGQDESYIASFDARNGETKWKVKRDEQDGWASPVVYTRNGAPAEILTVSRGQLGSHSLKNGTRLWSFKSLSPAVVASPLIVGDTLYTFGYGNESATPFSSQLDRYDKNRDGLISREEQGDNAFLIGIGKYEGNRDGAITKEEWDGKQAKVLAPSSFLAIRLERDPAGRGGTRPREAWRYEESFVGVIPSPLYFDGVLYVVKNGGILTSFDAASGEVAKAGRLTGALGGYSASPVSGDGKLYIPSEEGKISVVRAGRDWELLAVNDLGESCFATPALSEGSIYLRTGEALYCFRAAR